MRGVKTSALPALLLLAVVPGCSRDEAPAVWKSARPADSTELASAAKPAIVPPGQRRVIELEGGVRVEIVAEGQGPIVAPGDEVALSLKLVYVPVPPASAPAPDAAGAKAGEAAAEKSGEAQKDGAQKEAAEDAPKVDGAQTAKDAPAPDAAAPRPLELAPVTAEVEPKPEAGADAKSEPAPQAEVTDAAASEPAATDPAPAKPAAAAAAAAPAGAAAEAAPAEAPAAAAAEPTATEPTAPAPEPLAVPLEPVVVVDTRGAGTPIRARVGATGTLLPGLSRALVGLRQGTIAEVTLPPEAAYGAAGLPSAGIPPGTTLSATIEIREVHR